MALQILRLEDRILFDAAAPAVIAQVVDAQGDDNHHTPQDSQSSETQSQADHTTPDHATPGLVEAPVPAAQESQVNVLLVSSNVDNAQQLADSAIPGVITLVYDYNNTTLSQLQQMIGDALQGQKADSIGFATEGQTGFFYLLKDVNVTTDSLTAEASLANFWKGVGELLADNGRVDLLGCNIAGTDGDNFGLLSTLDHLLDANGFDHSVAASTDRTSNGEHGNWTLEAGNIDARGYFNADALSAWTSDLAVFSVLNTNNAGVASLRQAIIDANGTAGPDTISFNIPGLGPHIITLTTALPTLSNQTIIDGSTQPGYIFGTSNMITVNFNGNAGLTFATDGTLANPNEVRGLQFTGASGAAIIITGGINYVGDHVAPTNHGNIIYSNAIGISISGGTQTVWGNRIGTDFSGTVDLGNTTNGITISGGTNHVIGGSGAGQMNLISGNNGSGILISGSATSQVAGNYIGTDVNGTAALGNGVGITITSTGANTIGGNTDAHRNIISGNTTNGVAITAGTQSLFRNYIGTDVNGTADVGNGTNGIAISGGTNHNIGQNVAGQGNVISGNDLTGITLTGTSRALIRGNFIGTQTGGLAPLMNPTGILMSSTGASTVGGITALDRNIISGNTTGIQLTAGTQLIYGNFIGLDNTGNTALANTTNGITVTGGTGHSIGGTTAGQGNYIAGNAVTGIEITAGSALIRGNILGITFDGITPLGNNINISISSATASTIGGTVAGRNYISGGTIGILLSAGTQIIQSNYIGTNIAGNATGYGASDSGIKVTGGTNQNIGGNAAALRNIISGNTIAGISLTGGTALIRANYIGTDQAGTSVIANGIGIDISSALNSTVGGTNALERNIISGNTAGVVLSAGTQSIINNYIGTDVSGLLDLGNTTFGVGITGGTNHAIGGVAARRNIISGNNTNGIEIAAGTAVIKGNYIGLDKNGALPIGNTNDGIHIVSLGNSTIGGVASGERNVISANVNGIFITGGTQTIIANYIGLNQAGTADFGNTNDGIKIIGGTDHNIGGTLTTQRNVISGNNVNGIEITAGNAIIKANHIGTNAAGSGALGNGTGILITSSDASTIGGVTTAERNVISSNTDGILITAGTQIIIGNYIGVNAAGTGDLGNTNDGIKITGGTDHNIGGILSTHRNVISGNNVNGIEITGGTALIKANYIGTNATAAGAVANTTGINISSALTSTIGGSTAAERNIISSNVTGVLLSTGTQNVIGNYIGLNAAGTADLGNTVTGVKITGGADHVIGGPTVAERNVISGNNVNGIEITAGSALIKSNIIGLNAAGGAIITNVTGINISSASTSTIGGTTDDERNIISGNTNGITLSAGTQNVYGNYIGTDVNGTLDLGNTSNGVNVTGGTLHNIGGAGSGERNVISGNNGSGILIADPATAVIKGNYIGTTKTGTAPRGNGVGITVNSTTSNTIGGINPGELNVISANTTNGIALTTGAHNIYGNYIGTDKDGTADLGNTTNGIAITGGTAHVIGGTTDPYRNIISGNNGSGISITLAASATIHGNYIGTDVDGTAPLGNGIGITLSSTTATTIGGTGPGELNVISANTTNGIALTAGPHTVYGNYIGTDKTGTQDLGNTTNGISITSGTNHVIGGPGLGERNIISGNNASGISVTGSATASIKGNYIGTDVNGTAPVANNVGITISSNVSNTIGGTSDPERNIISANTTNGVALSGVGHNVYGNYIGTDVSGTLDLGNGTNGVAVTANTGHNIGGALPGQSNTISGNNSSGVAVSGSARANIAGNFIGTDRLGTLNVANNVGVTITSTGTSIIGGNTDAHRNIISANTTNGIVLSNGTQNVFRNFIGTDINGTASGLGNGANGILITAGTGHLIGQSVAGQGNVISGNGSSGITITGAATATIRGNFIGTQTGGLAPLPNPIGILISSTGGSTVGGTTVPSRNIISGNGVGIQLTAGTQTIQGNFIGLDNSGNTALANTTNGITVSGGTNHAIGGTAAGQGNYITGNTLIGIEVTAGTTLIRGNTIGITFDGLTPLGNNVNISISSTLASTIGSTVAGRNYISGGTIGILLSAGTQIVQSNYIGTNIAGSVDYGASDSGIKVTGGVDHNIGGTTTAQRNTISGNDLAGVSVTGGTAIIHGNYIGTDQSGALPLGNGIGIDISSALTSTIGGIVALERNVISANTAGIVLSNGTQNVINNYIGVAQNGLSDLGNTTFGIGITGGTNHAIGGGSAQRNIISGNNTNGIEIASGSAIIKGNYIGLDVNGAVAVGNTNDGIYITSTANSTIGGVALGERNVISSNMNGIFISGGTQTIVANYIGLNQAGTADFGNTNAGVQIAGGTAHDINGNTISGNNAIGIEITSGDALIQTNLIGTNTAGALLGNGIGISISSTATSTVNNGNVISANTDGVVLSNGTQVITGNIIGLNPAGSADLGNTNDGIKVTGGTAHDINGNTISGNNANGIEITGGDALVQTNYIGTNAAGAILGNVVGVNISSASASTISNGNIISANTNGVLLSNGAQIISNNIIGLNPAGLTDLGNSNNGILITGGAAHAISGNTISGNNNNGIEITGGDAVIQTNYIGTNAGGDSGLGNIVGVNISSASASTISLANIISGNTNGILLSNGTQIVSGNIIGLNPAGNAPLSNTNDGIKITGGTAHDINGNTISGNTVNGIEITAGDAIIQTNYIGTNAAGAVLGNVVGINISSASASTISNLNVISSNTNGILISNGTQIVNGNIIGLDPTGTIDRGNTNDGIKITGGTAHDISDNTISGNDVNGIEITAGDALIQTNFIGTNAAGDTLGNGVGILISSTATSTISNQNVISANMDGIELTSGTQIVTGNIIGLDPSGTMDLGNTSDGIKVTGGTAHDISGNTIGGNDDDGIEVSGGDALIQNNLIGTNASGDALGNCVGITLAFTSTSTVNNNVISANIDGIFLIDGTQIVTGNLIGLAPGGTVALGNTNDGIQIIGGTAHDISGNTISSNTVTGIEIFTGDAIILNNYIGTNSIGDVLGNGVGVSINSTSASTVSGNTISANVDGVLISDGTQIITGNTIGLDPGATMDLGNTNDGIKIVGGTLHDISGNTISGNDVNGIEITVGDAIIQNNLIGTNTAGDPLGNGVGINISSTSASTMNGNTISANTDGILLSNGTQIVTGNIIGLDPGGTMDLGNTNDGIRIVGGTAHNISGNTISGNDINGIEITVGDAIIQTNYIGTNAAGDALGNGVGINITSTSTSTISGNYISANLDGIILSSGTQTITGNTIGLDPGGTMDLGNTNDGILVIGGTAHNISLNTISGNDVNGIEVTGGDALIQNNIIGTNTGGAPLGNDTGVNISSSSTSTINDNIISANTDGVLLSAGTQTVTANTIGLNAGETADLGNTNDGIKVTGGTAHDISGNTISGNDVNGVEITGGDALVQMNYIGTTALGASFGNGVGVNVSSTSTSTINDNTISANTDGVLLSAGTQTVTANVIGLNPGETADLGNTNDGIKVIGGTAHDISGNTISGNDVNGVEITGGDALVQMNFIGVTALGASFGNGVGVNISSTSTSTINDNIISANTDGVLLSDGTQIVTSNIIGLDPGETIDLGNTNDGIKVTGGTAHDISLNTISGNDNNGVEITGGDAFVQINLIGTNTLGAALGNGTGVNISSTSTSYIYDNVISANTDGVVLSDGTQIVDGNIIGLDPGVTMDLGNTNDGVKITGGTEHEITFNVISGNDVNGVEITGGDALVELNIIGTNLSGDVLGNGTGVNISSISTSYVYDNLISANTNGVLLSNGTQIVEENIIGLDPTETIDLGNTNDGIRIIGGTAHSITGNTISGNDANGVEIAGGDGFVQNNFIGTNASGAILGNGIGVNISSVSTSIISNTNIISSNTNGVLLSNGTQIVDGNIIGLDPTGATDLGNINDGILITGGTAHIINGNTISGNDANGIEITGGTGTFLRGNLIGTDVTGVFARANSFNGIFLNGGTNTTIGGTSNSERNVISGNTVAGIRVDGGTASIINNFIGLAADGITALSNNIGIRLNSLNAVTVGGSGANEGNYISGNATGILITLGSHSVFGNFIGTTNDGVTLLANTQYGVHIVGGGNNAIGGPVAGEGNVIANSGIDGVLVDTSTGNSILRNSIYDNGNLGINLINNGNNNQVAPVLNTATYDPPTNTFTITGTLNATIGTNYTIEIFANPADNNSGKIFVTSIVLLGNGVATPFMIVLPGTPPPGTNFITATATDNTSADTSKFSLGEKINTPPVEVVNTGVVVDVGESVSITADNLKYTDGQQTPSEIIYTITSGPSTGFVAFTANPNVPITVFTQADIDGGLIIYHQNGFPTTHDQFTFNVTDGQGGSVNNQNFNITINPNLLAEPQLLFFLHEARTPLLPVFDSDRPFYHGSGFFNVEGRNQLTSFGTYVGFHQLALRGNISFSFNIVNGEPTLSNRNRDMGYGDAVSALNYVAEFSGFRTNAPEISYAIEQLSGEETDINFKVKPKLHTDFARVADDFIQWLND